MGCRGRPSLPVAADLVCLPRSPWRSWRHCRLERYRRLRRRGRFRQRWCQCLWWPGCRRHWRMPRVVQPHLERRRRLQEQYLRPVRRRRRRRCQGRGVEKGRLLCQRRGEGFLRAGDGGVSGRVGGAREVAVGRREVLGGGKVVAAGVETGQFAAVQLLAIRGGARGARRLLGPGHITSLLGQLRKDEQFFRCGC